jgi:TPR repeat protein
MLRAILLALALTLSAAPVAAGPIEDGVAAHERGDYETALRLIRPLAEQGDAKAQYNLGIMYDNGVGVPQDYVEAVKWYRMAAEQGFAGAQYNLGVMYANGRGVPQDSAEALKW